MAASADSTRFRQSRQTSDESSSRFPDRPIRPLPKRPIRSRLSEESASKIKRPEEIKASAPVYTSPPIQSGSYVDGNYYNGRMSLYQASQNHEYDLNDYQVESEDEFEHGRPVVNGHYSGQSVVRASRPKPHPPHSATSSADGYESFENTNNKKKRKIPIPGSGSHNLPLDVVSGNNAFPQTTSGQRESDYLPAVEALSSHASLAGTSSLSHGGASRMRNDRSARKVSNDRKSALGTPNALSDSINGLSLDENQIGSMRMPAKARAFSPSSVDSQQSIDNLGQIAQASAGQSPEQRFTFECKSDSSNKIARSAKLGQEFQNAKKTSNLARNATAYGQHPRHIPSDLKDDHSIATSNPTGHTLRNVTQDNQHPNTHPSGSASAEKRSKPRKPSNRDLAYQARQRKIEQEYNNCRTHGQGATWVCEFCEYESIFGEPPAALIRQYELKDRKRREEAEERARLLEKAKAKGRKTKKGSKGNSKTNAVAPLNTDASIADQYDPRYPTGSIDSPEDDYYDEPYFDDRGEVANGTVHGSNVS